MTSNLNTNAKCYQHLVLQSFDTANVKPENSINKSDRKQKLAGSFNKVLLFAIFHLKCTNQKVAVAALDSNKQVS